MGDDDFWNESDVKSSARLFSSDDREIGGESCSLQMCGISIDGTAQLFQQVQAGMKHSEADSSTLLDSKLGSGTQLELHQLISEKSLNCMMDADCQQEYILKAGLDPSEEVRMLRRQLTELWMTPDPKKTVQKMMLKQHCVLEPFRSLQSKKQLLQEAVSLGDGDTILMVVIFLFRTLKKSYFNQILLETPGAASHYVAYLFTRMRSTELTDCLEMLGKNKDASMKQFESASKNPQHLQRLVSCAKNHIFSGKDSQVLNSYIRFLEWQVESGVNEESVTDCLLLLCEKHWGETKETLSPSHFSQQQGISDKQYQWAAITARARLQAWQDIQVLLTAKSWLRGPKLRVALPMEYVVSTLHVHGAPQDVLYSFLQLIENTDKRLSLARQVACDKAIIEASMSLKAKQ